MEWELVLLLEWLTSFATNSYWKEYSLTRFIQACHGIVEESIYQKRNVLDNGSGCILSKSADNTKLGGVADTLEVRLTARGSLTGWKDGLKVTSSCSTRGTARSCFRGGTSTSVCWGLNDWKSAIQKRTWGGCLCAEPWLARVLWVPHGSCAVAVGTTEDCQPVPLPSLTPLCTLS